MELLIPDPGNIILKIKYLGIILVSVAVMKTMILKTAGSYNNESLCSHYFYLFFYVDNRSE